MQVIQTANSNMEREVMHPKLSSECCFIFFCVPSSLPSGKIERKGGKESMGECTELAECSSR